GPTQPDNAGIPHSRLSRSPETSSRTNLEQLMAYTYEELRHKTLAELRDIAKDIEHDAIQGYTQLNKEHLVIALAKALGIQHTHHDVVGIDKSTIKARIRQLKTQRAAAIEAHDHAQLKTVRRTIHRLKRQIHKATV